MGSQTTSWAIPYPVGTDRVMDGDNAIQALAERLDLLLGGTGGSGGGGALPANAPGLWQNATGMALCSDTSLTPIAGSSITTAKWMKIGKTVWYQGDASTGATAGTGGTCITLPNAQAGTPAYRSLSMGTLTCFGPAPTADQSFTALMHTNKDRIQYTAWTGGLRAIGANYSIKWMCCYEVL